MHQDIEAAYMGFPSPDNHWYIIPLDWAKTFYNFNLSSPLSANSHYCDIVMVVYSERKFIRLGKFLYSSKKIITLGDIMIWLNAFLRDGQSSIFRWYTWYCYSKLWCMFQEEGFGTKLNLIQQLFTGHGLGGICGQTFQWSSINWYSDLGNRLGQRQV